VFEGERTMQLRHIDIANLTVSEPAHAPELAAEAA
jgi:hypothetical protein